MKKIILGLVLALPFLTGCGVYGSGETIGYIYSVDDGVIWDEVWYKSSLESSQSDCYFSAKNSAIKDGLKEAIGKRVKLNYKRHLKILGVCDNSTEDEIVSFEVLE